MLMLMLLKFCQEICQDFNFLIWLMIILTKPFFFLIMLLMLVFAFYLEMKDSALFSMLLLHRGYKEVTKICYKDVMQS